MFAIIYNYFKRIFRKSDPDDVLPTETVTIRRNRAEILPFYWKTNKIHCEIRKNTKRMSKICEKSEDLKSAATEFAVLSKKLKDGM